MKAAMAFAFVALFGIAVAQIVALRRQETRLRELETALAKQSSPEGAAETLRRAGVDPARAAEMTQPGRGAAAGGPGSGPSRLDVEFAIDEATEKLEKRLAAVEKSVSEGAVAAGADPDALDAAVAKKVDEKMAESNKKKGGIFGDDNKRPLTEISKELGLTEQQEDMMATAIDASQREMFALITTPRTDGTNILDEVVEAFKDPENAQQKAQAAFLKLFTDRIPGSDETYLSRIMKEKEALNGEFGKFLTEEQMKKYTRLGQDPHEIQTGFDPYGQYMAERLQDRPK
jgi:hypothetical protein